MLIKQRSIYLIEGVFFYIFVGNYIFVIFLDDLFELWLSLNESLINVKFLVWVGNCILFIGDFYVKIVQFIKYKIQLFYLMFLYRGLKYFIEVLYKQGRMDDYVFVGWKIFGFDYFRYFFGKLILLFIDDIKVFRDVIVYLKFILQDFLSYFYGKFMNFKLDYDILKFGLDDLCDKVYVLNFVDECDIVNLFLRCLYNFSYLVDF